MSPYLVHLLRITIYEPADNSSVKNTERFFYVLLKVHFSVFLVIDQHNAQIIFL